MCHFLAEHSLITAVWLVLCVFFPLHFEMEMRPLTDGDILQVKDLFTTRPSLHCGAF